MLVAVVSDAIETHGYILKGNIYIIAKYCIDIIIYLIWKVEHLLAFPSI